MELTELREKRSEDLVVRLRELSEEIFRLRCTSEPMTPQKGAERKILRKEIARIKTLLRQRELDTDIQEELGSIDAMLAEVGSGNDRGFEERWQALLLRNRKSRLNRVRREIDIAKGK